jgi:hypothetical protein
MVLGVENGHPRDVSICGQRLLMICLAIAAVAAVLALRSASAVGARQDQQPCLWGASSVSAETVDGKVVVSPVATSGCIPTAK